MLGKLWKGSRRKAPVLAFAFALALPLAAKAGAGRTWVASNGNDSNTATNCAEAAPCQTFAAAYSVTNAGGEIVALDSAGYGPLTITNSVTIIGVHRAFIKPPPSSTGIIINAGASGKVLLDNIEINGAGGFGTFGIKLLSGQLLLKNSVLTQLGTGMYIDFSKADIINTDIVFNGTGIETNGFGIDPNGTFPGAATTEARLYTSNVIGNGFAFFMGNPGSSVSANTSKITILAYNAGTQDNHFIGNTTLVSGAGSGCPSGTINQECNQIMTFNTPIADNQASP